MTLGPKFFCCSKMAVTRRRSKIWWRKAHQSKALDVTYLSSLSKRDLKHSGTFFQKFACDLGFAAYEIFGRKGPCGHIKGALLENSQNSQNSRRVGRVVSVEKYKNRKNVENQFWPVLKCVKKYAEFNGAIRFVWNLLKWWVFDDVHVCIFLYFCISLYVGVGGMRL